MWCLFVLRSNVMGIRTHSHKITVIFPWGRIPHQPLALGHWGLWAAPREHPLPGRGVTFKPHHAHSVMSDTGRALTHFMKRLIMALFWVLCISAPWISSYQQKGSKGLGPPPKALITWLMPFQRGDRTPWLIPAAQLVPGKSHLLCWLCPVFHPCQSGRWLFFLSS